MDKYKQEALKDMGVFKSIFESAFGDRLNLSIEKADIVGRNVGGSVTTIYNGKVPEDFIENKWQKDAKTVIFIITSITEKGLKTFAIQYEVDYKKRGLHSDVWTWGNYRKSFHSGENMEEVINEFKSYLDKF